MKTKTIKKVLIANRGEIALRIMRTLKRMGIASVAVYHQIDSKAAFVKQADEAWPLGDGALSETYLNVDKIIGVALRSGADAIHPGYGFLSENPLFPEACAASGITFIGPEARTVRLMGNKIDARNLALANGLPVTAGFTGTPADLAAMANKLPYPVLVKAAAGGGGKGMRIVRGPEKLSEVLQTTSSEAANYFGDGTVYVEQYVEEPRHVEIQVLADHHGNVVHLFERECSIQRRYQKIIEEAPSPSLDEQTRQIMGNAAVALCKAIGYRNAGTIEFLLDANQKFFFLEMNTRIQVEHPVTELVTGIDLVEEQIRIAQGLPLSFGQQELSLNGHAIECRVYAEDPENNFLPSPGEIVAYHIPEDENIRIDSAVNGPTVISSMFDPMISKLIAWGKTRNDAIAKAREALENFFVAGIKTNIPFLIAMLSEDDFVSNRISTAYIDRAVTSIVQKVKQKHTDAPIVPAIAAVLCSMMLRPRPDFSVWHRIGFWRILPVVAMECNGRTTLAEVVSVKSNRLAFRMNDKETVVEEIGMGEGVIRFRIDRTEYKCLHYNPDDNAAVVMCAGITYNLTFPEVLAPSVDHGAEKDSVSNGGFVSPMPGKVIRVNVSEGEQVNRGTVMIVIEAMKMENNIVASNAAIVEKLNVAVGDMVDTKTELIVLKELTN